MPEICDMGQMALLPLRRKACCGFFRPKNQTALAVILGTRGQHANHWTTEATVGGVRRTPYSNLPCFLVSVCTQIGAVGGPEHTSTTERKTGRPIVFPVTESHHQLLEAPVGRVPRFQSRMVSCASGCHRHS
jgi:hypothetical protein